MKKLALVLTMLFMATGAAFAQSDLQALAVVKLNKSETITLKQLKNRCNVYEKQLKKSLTVDERKMVLDSLIEEKLMIQAAQKANIAVTDSEADQAFIQNMSQSLGAVVTEKELSDYVRKASGKTLDEFLAEQTGMNVSEYKLFLKNRILIQKYVYAQSQSELQKVVPTDEEIRIAYESNKSSFVWNDMAKVFLVLVPKAGNDDAERTKCNDLLNKYKEKKLTAEQIVLQSQVEGSGYQAGEILLPKNESSANGIKMSFQNLVMFFGFDEGYISDMEETGSDFRFIVLLKKYNAKMLSISDIVQPETTVTVYDYIRSSLAQQKQSVYISNQTQVISKSLNTSENVELKKTGAALDKLLNWGE